MTDTATFLLLRRAGHTLALPAALTRQALPLEALTPLPAASGVLRGLMPAAGRAVPVLHLEQFLALDTGAAAQEAPLVLLIESGEEVLGLPVDEVIGFVNDDRPTFSGNALLTEERVLGGYVGGGHKGRYLNAPQLFTEVSNQLGAI
ncbi:MULTISPECIES: chemotaxis protein CheW [Deinococcus]|uniref:Chemotaxis protein CheW n=1 Tax=Deinococcus cavernae TaxID=2320857 RepID=A0A418UZR3_9DEIO|nr:MULTISPECIES: chemotaxis protein CheW [Deinococcus]RJF68958.1 chemotaxis protein CheW [Deinococcus cavernae]